MFAFPFVLPFNLLSGVCPHCPGSALGDQRAPKGLCGQHSAAKDFGLDPNQ